MNPIESFLSRRRLLRGGLALGALTFFTPGVFAEQLTRTPRLTEGPFYPDQLPLDTDNDLLIINDSITPAVGMITHLAGRVLDSTGNPVKNAVVEIWQCDANQVYLHSNDSGRKKDQQDRNFQGFGRFTTASSGDYYFRTIKPVPYPGRPAPHIHVKVKKAGKEWLTSQIFIKGHPNNRLDQVFLGLRDSGDRQQVLVDFQPLRESTIGELSAHFDIVLGPNPAGPGEGRWGRRRREGYSDRPPRP